MGSCISDPRDDIDFAFHNIPFEKIFSQYLRSFDFRFLFTNLVPRIRGTPRFVSFSNFHCTFGHDETYHFFTFLHLPYWPRVSRIRGTLSWVMFSLLFLMEFQKLYRSLVTLTFTRRSLRCKPRKFNFWQRRRSPASTKLVGCIGGT